MIIQSDNKEIKKSLSELEKILVDNGAWFHPALSLNCAGNSISIEMTAPCDPVDMIIKVPGELLIPVEPLNLSVEGNKFVIKPDKEELSPVQLEISKLMFELYNLTEKVDFYKNESPWFTFRDTPELMDALLCARSTEDYADIKKSFMHNTPDTITIEKFIAMDFLQTRVLGYPGKNKEGNDNEIVKKLMPIVDYLDHDSQGGHYITLDDNNEDILQIQNIQPFTAQRECYVLYGFYDSIDTFLNYGFIAETTPFLLSIPLTIPVRDTDGLILNAYAATPNKNTTKQLSDLKKFMPTIMKSPENNALILSHLVISLAPNPHAMRRILRTIIRTLAGKDVSQKFVLDRVREAEQFIIEENIAFYKDLLIKVEKDKKTPDHLKQQIRHIASIQLNKINKYHYNEDYFIPAAQPQTQNDAPEGNAVLK